MKSRATRMGLLVLLAAASAGCLYWPRETDVPARPAAPVVVPQATADGRQVFIDMTTVRIPEASVAQVLGAHCPGSAAQPHMLTGAQYEQLWGAWQDDERVRVVQAPKLLALDGQEATIFIGETIRFARSKAETNAQGGLEFSIQDGPVFVGYKLRVVPTVSADGKRVALDLHAVHRTMKGGHTQHEIALMDQETFLRRVVRENRLDARFELPDDGYALLGSPKVMEDGDGTFVSVTLLHARVLQAVQARATPVSNG